MSILAVRIASALWFVDCLANASVGADLAVLAVPVLLTVGENNLLTETVMIANLTVGAVLVRSTLRSIIDYTSFLVASRARLRLTVAVRIAHVTGRAFRATLALGPFSIRGVFADGVGATAARIWTVMITRATSPQPVVYVYRIPSTLGILGILMPFLTLGTVVLRVGSRWRSGTADKFSSEALLVDVVQVNHDGARDNDGRGEPLVVIVVLLIPFAASGRRCRPDSCRRQEAAAKRPRHVVVSERMIKRL